MAFVIAVPAAFLIATDAWRRVALIAVIVLLMVVELLNTAIEKLSDHVTPDTIRRIGRIKDMGSAAVGLSLLLAGLRLACRAGRAIGPALNLPDISLP